MIVKRREENPEEKTQGEENVGKSNRATNKNKS